MGWVGQKRAESPPPYREAKTGVDTSTQVDTHEVFVFKDDVIPLLEVATWCLCCCI
jgi:hypothetical protein